MARFLKGDIVIGNSKADKYYKKTTFGTKWEVYDVLSSYIEKIYIGHESSAQGEKYWVDADAFDLFHRPLLKSGEIEILELNRAYRKAMFDSIIEDYKPKKKPFMKTLSTWLKKTLDADTQALVITGYLDEELEPTEKAYDAIDEMNFDDRKAALVEKAKAEIAEEEAKKKA